MRYPSQKAGITSADDTPDREETRVRRTTNIQGMGRATNGGRAAETTEGNDTRHPDDDIGRVEEMPGQR